MFTFMFFIAALVAVSILILIQPLGRRTIFEPGVLVVELFSLCYLLPALAIMFGANILPSGNEDGVETVSLYGFLFVVSFVLFYTILKSYSRWRIFPAPDVNILWAPRKFLFGFVTFFVLAKVLMGYYGVGDSDDYSQQYVVRASMPPAINQIINLLQAFQWMFVFLLLASSFANFTQRYSSWYVWIVAIVFASDMWLTNSRSNFVAASIVIVAAYMLYNRPIGLFKEISLAAIFVVILGVFAFRRIDSERVIDPSWSDILIPGEFSIIYGNAIHWASMLGTQDFVAPPSSSYLQSLIAFVPKQFNEGKWDLASWYVTQYFPQYAEAGGGLAFGIIPEAIVNWGLISIVFQAFVIALLFRAALSSAYANRTSGANVWVVFYLYSFASIYQLIRSHSFTIISGLVLGFVVPFLILYFLSKFRLSLKRPTDA